MYFSIYFHIYIYILILFPYLFPYLFPVCAYNFLFCSRFFCICYCIISLFLFVLFPELFLHIVSLYQLFFYFPISSVFSSLFFPDYFPVRSLLIPIASLSFTDCFLTISFLSVLFTSHEFSFLPFNSVLCPYYVSIHFPIASSVFPMFSILCLVCSYYSL